MATYTFIAEYSHYEEITVEAEDYDDAYDKAEEAANEWQVYTPSGYVTSFAEVVLEDKDIHEGEV